MTLVRWNPMGASRDLVGIQDEVNRLFDSFFTRTPVHGEWDTAFRPSIDIEEAPEEFVVRADLPGIDQKDVKVSLAGDTLTIRGERKVTHSEKNATVRREERVYGRFERAITLDAPVRGDKVKATYHDGVLEVRVPKAEEAKVREIEVQTV